MKVIGILQLIVFDVFLFKFHLDTAYGQNRFDGRWYYFDDSSVSGSDESSVCTNAAYLLIYLRQDKHQAGLNDVNKSNGGAVQSENMDC